MNEVIENIKRLAQEVKSKPKSGRLNLGKIKSNVQTVGFLEQSYSERDRAASDYAGELFDKAVDEGFDGGGIFNGALLKREFERGRTGDSPEYRKLLEHAARKFGTNRTKIESIRKAETDWILDGTDQDDTATYVFGKRKQKK